jgi:hypothetical protein
MIGNPNTRIRLDDLTTSDCAKILEVYKNYGLKVIDNVMTPSNICNTVKHELERSYSVEYTPDCMTENKLIFELRNYYEDKRFYLNVTIYPNAGNDSRKISDNFDKELRNTFNVK